MSEMLSNRVNDMGFWSISVLIDEARNAAADELDVVSGECE